ncbi:MAG: 30S ribosomal protein S8 [Thermaurantimonas sp.]|uniref:Small ribosomal subunit protein uS8 n=1 Tax=Thermaurantimonas aggregans TaxID=2173829 RepID=A0A401XN44_9FLAO|nr:30S ribosomal protein S8 [Thermaurantimonas aggregans]MCX8149578.1 30S ribosomal protein S8 [Thermaurantimonas aggregans]GCD78444.1 30S ribosomal protein S8 [Thermaurantimonas aggregans]
MYSDPIADFLTRIRNAVTAGHKVVEAPSSKMKLEIARILKENGFIHSYKTIKPEKGPEILKIALKYDPVNRIPAIRSIKRVSTPGLRIYKGVHELPRVLNSLGIAIISTNKGVMTDKQARKENTGGEVICYVY